MHFSSLYTALCNLLIQSSAEGISPCTHRTELINSVFMLHRTALCWGRILIYNTMLMHIHISHMQTDRLAISRLSRLITISSKLFFFLFLFFKNCLQIGWSCIEISSFFFDSDTFWIILTRRSVKYQKYLWTINYLCLLCQVPGNVIPRP